jgi:hypothetical protein
MSKLLAILLLVSTNVFAFETEQLPNIGGKIAITKDAEKFATQKISGETTTSSGIGLRMTKFNYDAPAFDADGNSLQLIYVKASEDWKVRGAVGSKSLNHENGSNSLLVADVTLSLILTDRLSAEVSADTDIVESINGVNNNIRYTNVTGSVDYLFTERLSLTSTLSNTWFTDDNSRLAFKNKLTYTIIPEYGVSVYGLLVNRKDSNAGSRNYWSPDTYASQSVGVKIRQVHSSLVYSAQGDVGAQQVKDIFGYKTSTSIYSWLLQVETPPGKIKGMVGGVTLEGSNTRSVDSASPDYYWTSATAWLKVPF